MRLIHFATVIEAEAMLTRLGIHNAMIGGAYTTPLGLIVISGMGVHATIHTLTKYVDTVDEIWSLGVAGSLKDTIPFGIPLAISSVRRNELLPYELDAGSEAIRKAMSPPLSIQSDGYSLCTSDYPIHHKETRRQLGTQSDLVDMEGYGVAYVAQASQKPCKMWKVVTDFASEGGRDTLLANLRKSSLLLCDLIT